MGLRERGLALALGFGAGAGEAREVVRKSVVRRGVKCILGLAG